jgi:hypothetical protein
MRLQQSLNRMRRRRFDSKSSDGKRFQEATEKQGDQIRTVWLLRVLCCHGVVLCCKAGEYEVRKGRRGYGDGEIDEGRRVVRRRRRRMRNKKEIPEYENISSNEGDEVVNV